VGQSIELRIALIERKDRGPIPPRVADPLEERDRRGGRRHDEDRLAPPCRFQPLQANSQVGRRVLGNLPAHKRGRQLGYPGQPAFLVQVRGEVPRLLGGRADKQQPSRRPGGLAQPAREGAGAVEPSGGG
jgi:hypothetical protein